VTPRDASELSFSRRLALSRLPPEVLLLTSALLRQLKDHFFAEAGRFPEHIIKPVKNLPEVFSRDGRPFVGHSCRKDYPAPAIS
jgi:hypothetical protein